MIMTKEEIFEKIKDIVIEDLCLTREESSKITLDTDIVETFGADELDTVECAIDIESKFNISIPEADCETYGMDAREFKLSKVVDYINDRVNPPKVPNEK